ncbi:MAG TPA: LuxR C-terminal-related transcriptional regulator [Candidatus Dormibacteraeota bacterium]|nr:LuxR C-terminal-related transcriptional regulator [Candidatus Dormibacteraeota bacterium]
MVFEALGMSADEELVYHHVLSHDSETPEAIARQLGIADTRIEELLQSLASRGLLLPDAAEPRGFALIPPEIVVTDVLASRQDELRRAQTAATQLVREYRVHQATRHPSRDLVDVIAGAGVIGPLVHQLVHSARREVIGFDRSPLEQPSDDLIALKLELLERGVSMRGVCDAESLTQPWRIDFMARVTAAGEQWRRAPTVPMRLLVVDRGLAILPHNSDRSGETILVRCGSLVNALVDLFELVWERSTPIRVTRDPAGPAPASDEPSARDRSLLSLMAAGLKDDAIARHLGMTTRTMERHLSRIMEQLGAQTRFETAVLAGARGWLTAAEGS